ncbi:hypothetical protein PXK30_00385 [Phaeobacter gallaeciensis]|uniref:hypothetical protein n=1 Tax=Phaeobacter gallaeciensis TaxID=60890 RepID=UPI00237F1C99|nr:hypothetical protein [Phaeobacter gallaeciensis]MEC9310615.1 hypothetical protein [Pseudomonadota bacterium]MDE4273605.1 hypothetical protein [Phaeobacter gallaeciensis]MDE4298845.1 hypothetical protein [Phaeobacter gallaeciensis]MDE4302150.1 hypothetical protein [Phaeobacter gallaeciensis]MDE4306873.1 hypothetical protein [Phaeobacter gallaeciensis]
MLFQIATYLALALLMVTAMTLMILKISSILGDCPQSGSAAQAAGVTIATGYAMIALGGIGLIGAAMPVLDLGVWGLLPTLGFAAICLGLGFAHAVATLRAVVREAVNPPATVATGKPAASAA